MANLRRKGKKSSPLVPLIAASAHSLSIALTAMHTTATTFASEAARQKAPGGTFTYAINGGMLAGFAMGLYPAQYGRSGVMAFIVSNNGGVCQKDRGKS